MTGTSGLIERMDRFASALPNPPWLSCASPEPTNVTLCQLLDSVQRMENSTIDTADSRVNKLGSSLFLDPATLEFASGRGVTDLVALIFGGRAGAMGDVDLQRMIEVYPFISPTMLEACWPSVEQAGGPVAVHRVLSDAQCETARAGWHEGPLQVIGATARDLVASVDGIAPGLFSGWRSIALDAVASGTIREIASIFALRELRGDIHIQSVRESGLTPFEAEIATRGPVVAELHGWPQPYPDVQPLEQRSHAAGERTSKRMTEIYQSALDQAAFDSFANALANVVVHRQ